MPEVEARLRDTGQLSVRRSLWRSFVNILAISCLYLAAFGLAHILGSSVQSGLAFALLIPCAVLSATDLEKREIPNWTSLWIACVGVGKWAWDRDWTLLALNLSLAALLWAGLTYVTGRIYDRREGQEVLGLGDIKLMAAMMVLLGAERVWIAVFLASLGGIIAFLLAQARKQVKDRNLPFGPMLAFATFLVCLGEGFEAIDWFMGR